ncbi:hypothetical protein DL769_005963 [Monosporascus sp. CRB-8-3]|nr:hypothetical protein DL769_005963 [Monosporascus sp. CRB-8-3]
MTRENAVVAAAREQLTKTLLVLHEAGVYLFPITPANEQLSKSLLVLDETGIISKDDVLLVQGVVGRRVGTPDAATAKKEKGELRKGT